MFKIDAFVWTQFDRLIWDALMIYVHLWLKLAIFKPDPIRRRQLLHLLDEIIFSRPIMIIFIFIIEIGQMRGKVHAHRLF